jgi:replicative DNA helicase
VYYGTTSPGLAHDVAALLLRLGIVARIKTLPGGDEPMSNVKVSGAESQRRFLDIVGAFGPRTANFRYAPSRAMIASYASLLIWSDLLPAAESDVLWDRIVAIDEDGEEEVFDLTVPRRESWLADGLISHNSGAIEQDSDLVMFIYREEYYEKESERAGEADIIIAKHRNGPVGDVVLTFQKEYPKFMNYAGERFAA